MAREYLPEGRMLPVRQWQTRHRAVLVFIFAHAAVLPVFGLMRGVPAWLAVAEGALIAGLGLLAAAPGLNRSFRSSIAALAAVTSSAVLVQFWGGVIEAHFHFFVVVALISLYQDWIPFLLSIAYVALDHGVVGMLAPQWVYNHPAALSNPWAWAIVHAVFVLAECVALVTVWKTNELARAQTEQVLYSAGEGIVGLDGEGRVVFANPAAATMAGRAERDLAGRRPGAWIRTVGGTAEDDLRPLQVDAQGPRITEALVVRPDGQTVPVELVITPITSHGQLTGAVVAFRDISERKRAENERAKAAAQSLELEQLRQMNLFKTQFINMAAHELNTPLTPIKVQLHLLKRRSAPPRPGQPTEAPGLQQDSIALLERNFNRLSNLVQELLDSTRLQSQHMRLAPQPVDVGALVQEAVASFQGAADEAGLLLRCRIEEGLETFADALRVQQVLFNLLTNAVKFTPRGGRIIVEAWREDGTIRLAVRDTGIGLSGQQRERLFQPFTQVHESQVSANRGSGLGLYISRGIAELHGGSLWCESAGPGLGSSFIVTLPVLRADPSSTQTRTGEPVAQ